MHTVTIQISDEDYNDMIEHLAAERLGRINVAVSKLWTADGCPADSAAWLEGESAAIRGEYEEERAARRKRQLRQCEVCDQSAEPKHKHTSLDRWLTGGAAYRDRKTDS